MREKLADEVRITELSEQFVADLASGITLKSGKLQQSEDETFAMHRLRNDKKDPVKGPFLYLV